jgi:D-alanyl-D-alanine carboxypeptidase
MERKLILILAIGLLSHLGFAKDFDKTKLDSFFDALETNNRFMGSVALSKDGEIIYTRVIGFSDIENNLKANENTKYRIASITKTFTAVLVFKAVEKGKISIDQTIDKYFPDIKNAERITIGQMLYHRSGIPNYTRDAEEKSKKGIIDIISGYDSDFEPDSRARYGNSNYMLLAYILEEIFNRSYSDLLSEHITKPIGLNNTYLGGKINTKNNESNSYRFEGDWVLQTESDRTYEYGSAGIVSTPGDLVKFSEALFGGELIRFEHLEQMKTIRDDFGMGLWPMPFQEKTGYGHGGRIDGFICGFRYYADGNVSFGITSNGYYNINIADVPNALLSAVYNEPYDIPVFKTYDVTSEDLDKYLGVYSSPDFPIKVTITKDGCILLAQGTGQSAFSLESTEKDQFNSYMLGLVLIFNPSENTMILHQRGEEYTLKKE